MHIIGSCILANLYIASSLIPSLVADFSGCLPNLVWGSAILHPWFLPSCQSGMYYFTGWQSCVQDKNKKITARKLTTKKMTTKKIRNKTTTTRTTTTRTTIARTTTMNTMTAKTTLTGPVNGNWVRHAKCPWFSLLSINEILVCLQTRISFIDNDTN